MGKDTTTGSNLPGPEGASGGAGEPELEILNGDGEKDGMESDGEVTDDETDVS
jgi:hypothetical protein